MMASLLSVAVCGSGIAQDLGPDEPVSRVPSMASSVIPSSSGAFQLIERGPMDFPPGAAGYGQKSPDKGQSMVPPLRSIPTPACEGESHDEGEGSPKSLPASDSEGHPKSLSALPAANLTEPTASTAIGTSCRHQRVISSIKRGNTPGKRATIESGRTAQKTDGLRGSKSIRNFEKTEPDSLPRGVEGTYSLGAFATAELPSSLFPEDKESRKDQDSLS